MNDRLVTAACVLGLLALLYGLFLQGTAEPPVTRPLSIESGDNGYRALREWLEGEGVRVLSLQQRLPSLAEAAPPLPAGGSILVTTLPHRNRFRDDEYVALEQWLARGNTLVVLAALDDTPGWASGAPVSTLLADLGRLTGLRFELRTADSSDAADTEERRRFPAFEPPQIDAQSTLELAPAAVHPLLEGVAALYAYSELPSSLWQTLPVDYGRPAVLRLANERASGTAAIWQVGRPYWQLGPADAAPAAPGYVGGTVIVSASASLLANRNIGEGDARRFVANLLANHLGPDGAVVFDDMHQGLTTLYDARAFFADSRFHATLVFLLAAWLAWVLGSSNRLAAPRPVVPEPRQRDFLAAAGGFMARRLDRCAAGLMLLDEWFDEIRHRRGLPADGAPPWAELEATPALDKALYRELREAHERLENGRPVGLLRLHNVLQQAREAIG